MDFYPLKAQYKKMEEVWLCLELEEELKDTYQQAEISISWLDQQILTVQIEDIQEFTKISVGTYDAAFAGYGAKATLHGKNKQLTIETAFDVTIYPGRSLRYGFVSDFTKEDIANGAIDQLRKYHINIVQFYDWSYRHDDLVSEIAEYQDMMGKHVSLDTVKTKIKQASQYGMKTIAYGAVYAASKEFYEQHRDWAFYNSNREVFRFIDTFYIMNIQKNSPWRKHLIKQYQNAIELAGFSGIHMDTYGFPKTAYSELSGKPEQVELKEEFGSLIDETRQELSAAGIEPYLIFNNVGNWPVSQTACHGVDAVYIEVWPPYERYFHIKQLISEARQLVQDRKPVILAAYLDPFRTEDEIEASYAARLLTAVIITNGAYHLLLGENNAVLTQGYYGDYYVMSSDIARVMRKYYDFMIRYMNLFYNPELVDVTMTHMGWDNYEYQFESTDLSAYGEKSKIWITIRESQNFKLLSFINLCGCQEDYWNKGKKRPLTQKNITCIAAMEKDIKGIYYASPDLPDSAGHKIEYERLSNDKGNFIKFTIPQIDIWTIVYIRLC